MSSLRLRVLFSLVLLAALVGQTTLERWRTLLTAVNPPVLAAALGVYLISMILRGLKYHHTLCFVGVPSRAVETIGLYFRSVPYFLVPGMGEDRYRLNHALAADGDKKTRGRW